MQCNSHKCWHRGSNCYHNKCSNKRYYGPYSLEKAWQKLGDVNESDAFVGKLVRDERGNIECISLL